MYEGWTSDVKSACKLPLSYAYLDRQMCVMLKWICNQVYIIMLLLWLQNPQWYIGAGKL